jgi:hypothetical protein
MDALLDYMLETTTLDIFARHGMLSLNRIVVISFVGFVFQEDAFYS